jgi:hypothetical protein
LKDQHMRKFVPLILILVTLAMFLGGCAAAKGAAVGAAGGAATGNPGTGAAVGAGAGAIGGYLLHKIK